jgi:hypothetical protein
MRHAASLDKMGQLKQCDEAWKLPIKTYGTGSGNIMGKKNTI